MSEHNSSSPESVNDLALRALELLEPWAAEIRRERRADRTWTWVKRFTMVVMGAFGFYLWLTNVGPLYGLRPAPAARTVSVIHLAGEISETGNGSARVLVPAIAEACGDSRVQAIVIHIHSPGGSPSQAERIGRAIDRCRESNHKPIDAVIESMGASAAYMVALHADRIVADRYAMVGSIGAIISQLDASKALARVGIEQRAYASGEFKAMLSNFRADTPRQAHLAQDLVDGVARSFADSVRERRGTKLKTVDDLTSGRVWTAEEARAKGLIDEVAVIEDLVERDYPGAELASYMPRRTLADSLSLEAFSKSLADALLANAGSLEVH